MRVLVPVLFILLPFSAAAQTATSSFWELEARKLLKPGDAVLVSYSQEGVDDDALARGELVALTGLAISVRLHSGEELHIQESNVHRIVREHKDSVWKGAFIGAGVGLGVTAGALTAYCDGHFFRCERGQVAAVLWLCTGLGFGVGAGY